jgi:hypothetical protein
MERLGTRLLTFLAAAWLLVTGAFLFVKGLDISLVACDERTCGDVADLVPGIIAFVAGVGMLLAWPFVASDSESSWSRRLGIGLLFGALIAVLAAVPILAVTERLGIPFWICVTLISIIAIRPPTIARDLAIRGRGVVIALLAAVIVGAEIFLDGDAYVLAFTMCVALTPPAVAGVDDFAIGWNARASASEVAVKPEELRAAGEVDDAQDQENDQQDPDDVVHAASSE